MNRPPRKPFDPLLCATVALGLMLAGLVAYYAWARPGPRPTDPVATEEKK
jgi:hypothetical protein